MSFSDIVNQQPDWMLEGKCSDLPQDEVFFPSRPTKNPPKICSDCPVAKLCLDHGRKIGAEGYWGGQWLDSRQRRKELRDERFAALYERGFNDVEIAAATPGIDGPTAVGRWRAATNRPTQAKPVSGGFVNRFGEVSCRYGHAVKTDSTTRSDGQMVCITCAFGELRAAG